MKNLLLFLLVLVWCGIVNAQSPMLTDKVMDMESMCQKTVMQAILPVEAEVAFTSVIIIETETGKVLANLNLSRSGDEWVEDDDHEVAANHTRLALYLALLESGATPSDRFYSSGLYADESGVFVKDRSRSHGGYGNIRLAEAVTRSDVSLIEACAQQFDLSMGKYAYYFSLTGFRLSKIPKEKKYEDFLTEYEGTAWNPAVVLGYQSKVTPLEMARWIEGVANHGVVKSDSEVLCSINCGSQHIDSLQFVLRDNVLYGTAKKVSSNEIPVSGACLISPENGQGYLTATFLGYTPTYTIVVNVEGNLPVIRSIPVDVARKVVNWIAKHRLGMNNQTNMYEHKRKLPRGVD
ncbi:MAG: hypothetical protein IKX22_09135 [Prevotella sp.]|nr:hypothetical protein [Prevotella sp.]